MELRHGFGLRIALIGDLFVYTIALMLFATLPLFGDIDTNPLTKEEVGIALFGIPALVGLAGRLLKYPNIPLNEWTYLYLGGYAIVMLAIFFTVGNDQAEWPSRVLVVVWFFSGVVGSFGAHILDGSKEPLARRLNSRYGVHNEG